MPEDLARDHIISWSNEGDVILDPMMGGCTTGKVAILEKRKFIGFDISMHYVSEICIPRLEIGIQQRENKDGVLSLLPHEQREGRIMIPFA